MTASPNDPNPHLDPVVIELRSIKYELAELRADIKMSTTFKISNQVKQGIDAAVSTWLPIIIAYLLLSYFWSLPGSPG